MPEQFEEQRLCYQLPYGIFGILGWFFSTLVIIVRCRQSNEPSRLRERLFPCIGERTFQYLLMIASGIMVIVPAIRTCIKCRGEWYMLLISLGQLSSWGFALVFDGFGHAERTRKKAKKNRKKVLDESSFKDNLFYYATLTLYKNKEMQDVDEKEKEEENKNTMVLLFGMFLVILSSIIGWIGTTGLLIYSYKIKGSIVIWMCVIYIVAIFILLLALLGCINYLWLYFTLSLNSIGSSILLAINTNQWASIEIGMIFFLTGKFINFVYKAFF